MALWWLVYYQSRELPCSVAVRTVVRIQGSKPPSASLSWVWQLWAPRHAHTKHASQRVDSVAVPALSSSCVCPVWVLRSSWLSSRPQVAAVRGQGGRRLAVEQWQLSAGSSLPGPSCSRQLSRLAPPILSLPCVQQSKLLQNWTNYVSTHPAAVARH